MLVIFMVTSVGAAGRSRNGPDSPRVQSPSRVSSLKPYQVGKASWYGKRFHGRTTASGEPYDMFQFTAAHKRLPLGTLVRVTNLRNRRWVIVRVNDRGPIPPARIIDLSYGAAQVLGLRDRGVARVQLDIVENEQVAWAGTPAASLP